jgi:hypothetical protein
MTASLPASFQNILDRLATSDEHRTLMIEAYRLGNELDAAYDGALHHAYDAMTADRMMDAIEYKYDRARKALTDYEQQVSA